MNYDYLIVGAGFFGATVAERLAATGKKILTIDRRPHLALSLIHISEPTRPY